MGVTLDEAVNVLHQIAPLDLAEPWDNVGLLIEPPAPREPDVVLLAIDLTEPVLDEAVEIGAGLIVAYHPPIFEALKRLTRATAAQRIAAGALAERIAVYCPHTALDAVAGGVNDWLADGLGAAARLPIVPAHAPGIGDDLTDADGGRWRRVKIAVFVPAEHTDDLRDAMSAAGAGWIGNYSHCSFNLHGYGTFWGREGTDPRVGKRGRLERVDEVRMEMVCDAVALRDVVGVLLATHPYEEPAYDIYPLLASPHDTHGAEGRRDRADQTAQDAANGAPGSTSGGSASGASGASGGAGQGRWISFVPPLSIETLVERIKQHLGLEQVRLARAAAHASGAVVGSAAVCAGAGAAVLRHVEADVYLTGEMRHHDVLAANAAGTSVILTDHTHTERGYLTVLRDNLADRLGPDTRVRISERDAEPLHIV